MKKKLNAGFTLVELIVVIGIVAVLLGMIFYSPDGSDERKADYNTRSRLFFLQLQNIYTDYSINLENGLAIRDEYVLSDEVAVGTSDEEYVLIIAQTANTGGFSKVRSVKLKETELKKDGATSPLAISKMRDLINDFASAPTESEEKLKDDLTARLSDIDEGFYYALIDSKNRVRTVHFKRRNFSGGTDFANHLTFISDNYTSDGIVGTYSQDININIPTTGGSTAFPANSRMFGIEF